MPTGPKRGKPLPAEAAASTSPAVTSAGAQEWNPLPALLKFSVKTVITRAVFWVVLHLIMLPIAIAAARATHGWVHLVFSLLTMSVFMALAQSVGALLALHWPSGVIPLVMAGACWLFLWPLLDVVGVSDDDKLSLATGVLAGIVVSVVIWISWGLLARRFERIKYHPGRLKGWRWYARLSLHVAGWIGGLVGIGLANM